MASEAVQVCCRLRPRRDDASATCVHSDGSSTLSMRGAASTGLAFSFNHVLGEAATQADVYDAVGRPVVASVCAGVNGAILAFGQTGSGKTHTIHGTASAPGLVPHAMAEIPEENVDPLSPPISGATQVTSIRPPRPAQPGHAR